MVAVYYCHPTGLRRNKFATLQEEHSVRQEGTGAHPEREKSGLDQRKPASTAGRGEGMAAWHYGKGRGTGNKGGKGFKQRG